MVLTIKAKKYKGQPLISPLTAVFDKQGGKLGRSSGNQLVLADEDKYVSSEHAIIKYENGDYYYVDTSLNGTQIINRNQRVHHKIVQLKDQDELRVGDYDLVLSITSETPEAPSDQHSSPQETWSLSMFDQDNDENREPQTVDHLEDDSTHEHPDDIFTTNNDFSSEIDGSFVPPVPVESSKQASELPVDLSMDDFFCDEQPDKETQADTDSISVQTVRNDSKPPVDHAPQKTDIAKEEFDANLTEAAADLLNIFFKAAGIEDTSVFSQKNNSELMRIVGTVFRELVDGLMTVLRGRTELKSHLRVEMTILKPAENNPLKFSPTVEEALTTFLTNNHPGFVDAVDAVREGYEDIKNHQLAINAGVQASLAGILKRFDPQHFSKKFEEGIVLQRKAKCWDEYRQAYQQIVEEALEDFFGEQFVCAYEMQIDKLRTNRK